MGLRLRGDATECVHQGHTHIASILGIRQEFPKLFFGQKKTPPGAGLGLWLGKRQGLRLALVFTDGISSGYASGFSAWSEQSALTMPNRDVSLEA